MFKNQKHFHKRAEFDSWVDNFVNEIAKKPISGHDTLLINQVSQNILERAPDNFVQNVSDNIKDSADDSPHEEEKYNFGLKKIDNSNESHSNNEKIQCTDSPVWLPINFDEISVSLDSRSVGIGTCEIPSIVWKSTKIFQVDTNDSHPTAAKIIDSDPIFYKKE